MAREPNVRYFHVFYDAEPKPDQPERLHDLKNGVECWCEPKSFRASNTTVVVVHDEGDWLFVIEDSNGRNQFYPGTPGTPGPPGPPGDPKRS